MRGRVGKLLRLSATEWWDLLAAHWALAVAWIVVATRPRGRLAAPSNLLPAGGLSKAVDQRAQRVALAVGRASGFGFIRPRCLVQAVALQRMLEARGIEGSRVCIGVWREGSEFIAHAWVEYGGKVLGDTEENVRRFTPLPDLRVKSRV